MKKFTLLLLVTTLILGGLSASCTSPAVEHYNRGQDYLLAEQFDETVDEFPKAIELDPNNAWAYGRRDFTYNKKGEYDRTITDLTKAIELSDSPTLTQQARDKLLEIAQR
tara:strand:+ start:175 stop:504 length:330 start_codon:yes stop_codon:yes gene_type:complete